MWFLSPETTQTYTLVMGVVPGDRLTKMEFNNWFGHALSLLVSAVLSSLTMRNIISNPLQVLE